MGCLTVNRCGDGRMTTDDDWMVNDSEAAMESPEPPNSHAAVGSGSEHTARRGSTLVWYPLPALLLSAPPLVRSGCLQPVLHAALLGPSPSLPVPLALLEPPAPPRLPLPPLEHGPQPGDAGLYQPCCL